MMRSLRRLGKQNRAAWLLIALVLAACHRPESAPSVANPPQLAPPSSPPEAVVAQPRLTWKLPAGWEEVQASEMRLASFTVKAANGQQADVGIIALPGNAGGDLPNVNRWREQVGLPAAKQEDLPGLAGKVEVGGRTGRLYEQAGQNPSANERSRILVAILSRDDTTWFFKMNGDDELVAAQKPVFLEFLKNLQFVQPAK